MRQLQIALVLLFFAFTTVAYGVSAIAADSTASDVVQKLSNADLTNLTAETAIKLLGEPIEYCWGDQTFSKDKLPSVYCMAYPDDVILLVLQENVEEVRFHNPGYSFKGIQVGSALDDVVKKLGEPSETLTSTKLNFKEGVLYRDVDGKKGSCYYHKNGARLFFENYKVTALYYVIGKNDNPKPIPATAVEETVDSTIKPYDDVRAGIGDGRAEKDLKNVPLEGLKKLIPTFSFNRGTAFPDSCKAFAVQVMENAKNPGLGVRALHKQGITGKGVNVAIIDQPLFVDHPEFKGKIASYKNFCAGEASESIMHGPAVMSLLAGKSIGTAPGARVYFAAAPSWTGDAAYYAKALDWIIEQNKKLPVKNKIRVVSISAAPSGPGSPFTMNNSDWDKTVDRAEKAGILVLDCTSNHGIVGPSFFETGRVCEDASKCKCGFPSSPGGIRTDGLLVPASPRTTAEVYEKGNFGYQYDGEGGLSWAIPYAAGVLAMGWQIKPELTKDEIIYLLMKSAYIKDGAKFINPPAFIKMVRKFKR